MSRPTARSGVLAALAVLAATPTVSSGQSLYESPAATARLAGIELPMAVDTFDVIRIRATPVAGLGIGASYATPLQTSSHFTLYVFSNGDTLEEQFESAIGQLTGWLETQEDTLTVITLDERGPVEVEGTDGTTYAGYRAVGTYDREGDRQRTWLYVFEKDGQLVKHRAHGGAGGADREPMRGRPAGSLTSRGSVQPPVNTSTIASTARVLPIQRATMTRSRPGST